MHFAEWFENWAKENAGYSDLRLTEGHRLAGRNDAMRNIRIEDSPVIQDRDFALLFEGRDIERTCLDEDFSVTIAGRRYRVNLYRERGRIAASLRLLQDHIPTLSELGLPEKVIMRFCRHNQGLVIFTGPTGSGKSTSTVSMMIAAGRERGLHIVTIEDPIEYLLPDEMEAADGTLTTVHQREVGADTSDFHLALRSALRQNPNVISVGEVRDRETAEMMLKAANTGHLVFATMHTKSAPGAVSRLIDFFEAERQVAVCADLADAVVAVVGQALLPAADGSGRVLAYEIMTADGGVGPQIRKGKIEQIPNEMRQGGGFGMVRMDDSLARLVREKRVTVAEAARAASNPEEFRKTAGAA